MAKKTKAVWDEVTSVEPVTSTEKPPVTDNPEAGVPFGSKSAVQKVVVAYRKHYKENPPEKNGIAITTSGSQYNYYLSSDIFEHADEFVGKQGFILELGNYVNEGGHNVMQLILEHVESGQRKVVDANLGNPNSMADFGARITYAPKYLLAIMFGISVQTDTDANGSGRVKTEPQVQNVTSTPEVTTTAPVTTTSEPSKSYQKAREFIEKASLVEMLDQAAVKVDNSTQMTDEEKGELKLLISERRAQLTK